MQLSISQKISDRFLQYLFGCIAVFPLLTSAVYFHITLNQIFALTFSLVVCGLWFHNKVYGLTSAVVFFLIKPFWLRLAYDIDMTMYGNSGFDLLGITPTLILVGFIGSYIYFTILEKKKLCPDKTRILIAVFSALCFVSIFFPTNSIVIGLGGFQRNIFPNMLILFLSVSIFKTEKDILYLVKSLTVVGLITILYGIGQFIVGIYPWEILWMKNIGFANSTAGWLTIGIRGIEFRIFSMFYYRTDFFFTNVLIFTLLITYAKSFTRKMKFIKISYYTLWFLMMIVTFERTPFIMSALALAITYYLNASKSKKKQLITVAVIFAVISYSTLLIFEPYLKSSGIDSLIRLAEMTNPLEADSIHDRADNYWGPALDVIKANPMGVGIGNASATKASGQLNFADTGSIHTHNEILQKVFETGYFGGLLFLILMISILIDSLHLSKIRNTMHKFGNAMSTCTLVFMMSSMITLTFSGGRGLTYWLLVGIMLGTLDRNKSVDTKIENKVQEVEYVS